MFQRERFYAISGIKRIYINERHPFILSLPATNSLLRTSNISIVSNGNTWFWMKPKLSNHPQVNVGRCCFNSDVEIDYFFLVLQFRIPWQSCGLFYISSCLLYLIPMRSSTTGFPKISNPVLKANLKLTKVSKILNRHLI